jgi:hypothetical protein
MPIQNYSWDELQSEGMLFYNNQGFVNDETPLDEYTLNQVLRAILNNKSRMETSDSAIEVLQNLIDNDVIKSSPSVKVDYAMYNSTKYENPLYIPVGTETQLPSIHLTFNRGEYKYGTTDTGIKLTSIQAIDTSNNSVFCSADNTSVAANMIKMPKLTPKEKTYTYKFRCEHSEGNIPVNNVNQKAEQISAGTIETSNDFTVIGYYEGCYFGASTYSLPTTITPYYVQSVGASGRSYVSGSVHTLKVPVGTKYILIACPNGEPGPKMVLNKTVNAPMTTLYGSNNVVKKLTLNNGKGYNVWVYVPSVELTQEATLEITLG